MVFKTLIAATCAAALAGSMVYFSTSPDGTSGSVKLDPAANAQVQPNKSRQTTKETNIIDRYINRDDNVAAENQPGNPYKASEETLEESVKPGVVVNSEVNENNQPVAKPKFRKKSSRTKKAVSNDPAQMRIDVVFQQVKHIGQVDLRDRAYLDLADYATNKGLFDQAQKAALKINQAELRDTARSRIAIGMARYGMADEAFALIGKVEVKELEDIMRLQVIEALLGSDQRQ